MSETATLDIRKAITNHASENANSLYGEVVQTVADVKDVSTDRVERELDQLQKEGFVYLVPTDDGKEVRAA